MLVVISVQVLFHLGMFLKRFLWLIAVSLQESEMSCGPLHITLTGICDFHKEIAAAESGVKLFLLTVIWHLLNNCSTDQCKKALTI